MGGRMPAFRLESLVGAAAVAAALVLLIAPGASRAYTPEQQQACTPDAMRLCGEFVPNVDAITACMVQKKAQLSPQCAVFVRHGPERGRAASDAADRPMSLKPSVSRKKTSASKSKKPKREDG